MDTTSAFIVGIDGGTECLGVSALEIDVIDLKLLSVRAQTLHASKLYQSKWVAQILGDRQARLLALGEKIKEFLDELEPIAIAIEGPFYNRFRPGAFGPLVEVIDMVRSAVRSHSSWRDLMLIDPSSVKKSVGAKGGAKKDAVRNAVLTHPEISKCLRVDAGLLDEHSVDAIAVGFAKLQTYRTGV